MNVRGTKTEENVMKAFAGESQARNKYTYFADQARKEGNLEIAELFERMAKNELTHAKIWFTLLNAVDNTEDNLKTAAIGESYEFHTMYPEFAAQARADGLEALALMFEKVAAIEQTHELTFTETLSRLKSGELRPKSPAPAPAPAVVAPVAPVAPISAEKPRKGLYRCQFCGMESDTRMDVCPVCQAIGAFERAE